MREQYVILLDGHYWTAMAMYALLSHYSHYHKGWLGRTHLSFSSISLGWIGEWLLFVHVISSITTHQLAYSTLA